MNFSLKGDFMAIVTSHFEITVKLVDEGANFSTLTFYPRDTVYADVVTAKTALVAALDAITDCTIQRVSINEVWKNDAFSYPSGVETANKLSMTVELAGGIGKKANIKVPGPIDAMFGASGTAGFNTLDTSNAAVITYTNLFKAAGDFYVSDGEDLETLISGKRIHAKQYDG